MGKQFESGAHPLIGEIYMMHFGDGRNGSEQRGLRPGLVFQNNTGNRYSPNVIALPLTSSLKKLRQPTHVLLKSGETGLPRDSLVLCENPECISKEKLGDYITRLTDEQMRQVASAYLVATSAISFLDVNTLLQAWQISTRLNGPSL